MSRKPPNQGSTPESRSDEYYTPSEVMRIVRDFFGGTIDLDPASCAEANLTVRATRYYTKEDNGLIVDWRAATVWANPPFSLKTRFVEKLHHHYQAGDVTEALCLIPAAVDTVLWQRYIRLYAWCAWSGRINFDKTREGVTFPSAIIYFGTRLDDFSTAFGPYGLVYPPALSAGKRANMQQLLGVV